MSLNPGSITLPEISILPVNPPPVGKYFVYIRAGAIRYYDNSSNEYTLSTGITAEQVEDIVGNLITGGSGITVTYNDAGNVLTIALDSATQTALTNAANHIANTSNPHATTKAQVGLGNVDNTSDLNKPISTATQSALNAKQDLDADLTAVAGLTTSGLITRTGAGTATTRTVAAGTGISIANGDGVSGNPTVTNSDTGSAAVATHVAAGDPHPQYLTTAEGNAAYQPLDSDLTAVAGLATQGIIARTGAGTATTRSVAAGTGITVANGDAVAGNPTVSLSNVGTAGTYGSATTIPSITTNAQGQVSAVTNNLIAIPSTQVTDFNEAAQDAVGGILTDSSSVDFTYSDGSNTIQAFVIPGGVDHNGLANLAVGNPHTQYLQTSVAASTYQPLDSDLTAVAGLATQGLIARTGAGTATTRTVTAGTGISVANGDGLSGNPTITNSDTGSSAVATHEAAGDPHPQYLTAAEGNAAYQPLDADLTALAGLASTGIVCRTGANTYAERFIAISTGLSISNPGGVGGNPTISNADTGSAAVSNHVGLSDPHAQYQLEANLQTDVRSTPVTGFSATPDSPVVTTDTLLAAIGKLQAQIDRLTTESENWFEQVKAADTIVNSNTTLTNITDLSIPVVAGNDYYLEYTLLFRTAATGTGLAVSLNTSNTAAGEGSLLVNMPIAADGTAALYTGTINGFGDVVTGTGVQTAQPSWFVCNMKGVFRCTTSGDLVPQFRSEVNGSNVNCGAGSTVLARRF